MIKFSSQWSALVSSNSSSGWLVCNDGPWAFSGPLVSTLFLAVGSLCSNPCRKYPFLLFFFLTAFSCLGAQFRGLDLTLAKGTRPPLFWSGPCVKAALHGPASSPRAGDHIQLYKKGVFV